MPKNMIKSQIRTFSQFIALLSFHQLIDGFRYHVIAD